MDVRGGGILFQVFAALGARDGDEVFAFRQHPGECQLPRRRVFALRDFADARDQQIVLGKVMQILYDRPTLEGPELAGTLGTSGDIVRVIFNTVPLQEVSWVWQALETPYRLSVSYTVRVTMLDSTEETFQHRVLENTNKYGQRKEPIPNPAEEPVGAGT